MVSNHSMNNFWGFAKTTRYLSTDNSVRSFDFLINGLAHIMEQGSCLTYIDIGSQLIGNRCGEDRDLNRVSQDVLTVAGTEVQPAQKFKQVKLLAMEVGLNGCTLA